MGFNTGVFSGPNGSMRLFTIILGAIVVGITADSYLRNVQEEEFFFWTAVVLLIVSAVLVVAAFLGILDDAVFVKKADSGFHVIGGIVVLVAGVLMLISVVHYGEGNSTAKYVQRLAAGILGILNALIYCSLGYSMCRG